MKVSKAIELLTKIQKPSYWSLDSNDLVAIGLGIEALKFLERMRINYPQFPYTPLPGETPEKE